MGVGAFSSTSDAAAMLTISWSCLTNFWNDLGIDQNLLCTRLPCLLYQKQLVPIWDQQWSNVCGNLVFSSSSLCYHRRSWPEPIIIFMSKCLPSPEEGRKETRKEQIPFPLDTWGRLKDASDQPSAAINTKPELKPDHPLPCIMNPRECGLLTQLISQAVYNLPAQKSMGTFTWSCWRL